jgi:predicted aldo/keto reductase-like oxidoreductase
MKRRHFVKRIGTAAAALPLTGCSAFVRRNKYADYQPAGDIQKRQFGQTGIEVSILGFGSHLKPELIKDPVLRDRMIKLGFDGGINTFDVYDHGGYKQFEPMGNSLRDIGRKKTVISLCVVKGTDEMEAEIDEALKLFHTDYIDLYRLYSVDDDRMNIMTKAKQAGKIRAVGVVSHDEPTMVRYIDQYGSSLDYVMIVYNFHNNKGNPKVKNYPYNDYSALIPRCEKMKLGILGIKPMGSDAMIAYAKEEGFFKNRSANVAQAMLRHIYASPEIDCTMPAMNDMGEVVTNLESAYKPALSVEERALLAKLSGSAARMKEAYLPDHYKWLENWRVKTV